MGVCADRTETLKRGRAFAMASPGPVGPRRGVGLTCLSFDPLQALDQGSQGDGAETVAAFVHGGSGLVLNTPPYKAGSLHCHLVGRVAPDLELSPVQP